MVLKFLILLLYCILKVKAQPEQCYAESASPYVYFSSKTSYSAGRYPFMKVPKNCEPVYIWALIRHGTRYPETKLIQSLNKLYELRDEIILNHKSGRGNLCEKDLINLKKWSTNLTMIQVNEYDLAPQGINDQIFLARRYKEIFPTLFKSPTKDSFMFQNSGQTRTKESAIAFASELTGTNFTTVEVNKMKEDAELLQITEHCPTYSEISLKPSTYTEVHLFEKSAYFQKIIAEISIRLGYLPCLPYSSITLMYDICAYENAWYVGSKPPFCAAFSSAELEAFDYLYDMHKYHLRGYGNPIVNHLGCPIMRDLITSLRNASQNLSNTYIGKFLFSHSEMITPLTSKLGLNKDEEPLRHDNYQKMIKQRKWRLGLLDSFAANILAVLYKCSSQGQNNTQTKVVIYQNERAAIFPQCNNSSLCDLETFQQMFPDVFDEEECSTKFCRLPDTQKASLGCSLLPNTTILASIFFILYYSI